MADHALSSPTSGFGWPSNSPSPLPFSPLERTSLAASVSPYMHTASVDETDEDAKAKGKRAAIASNACSFCQRRHIRCDGSQPCAQCVKRGFADKCEFVAAKKRGKKSKLEDGTPSQPPLSSPVPPPSTPPPSARTLPTLSPTAFPLPPAFPPGGFPQPPNAISSHTLAPVSEMPKPSSSQFPLPPLSTTNLLHSHAATARAAPVTSIPTFPPGLDTPQQQIMYLWQELERERRMSDFWKQKYVSEHLGNIAKQADSTSTTTAVALPAVTAASSSSVNAAASSSSAPHASARAQMHIASLQQQTGMAAPPMVAPTPIQMSSSRRNSTTVQPTPASSLGPDHMLGASVLAGLSALFPPRTPSPAIVPPARPPSANVLGVRLRVEEVTDNPNAPPKKMKKAEDSKPNANGHDALRLSARASTVSDASPSPASAGSENVTSSSSPNSSEVGEGVLTPYSPFGAAFTGINFTPDELNLIANELGFTADSVTAGALLDQSALDLSLPTTAGIRLGPGNMLYPATLSPVGEALVTPELLRQEMIMKMHVYFRPIFPFMDLTAALNFAPYWNEEWDNLSLSSYKRLKPSVPTLVHAFSFAVAMANASRTDAPRYTLHFLRKAELLYHILFFHEGLQTHPEWADHLLQQLALLLCYFVGSSETARMLSIAWMGYSIYRFNKKHIQNALKQRLFALMSALSPDIELKIRWLNKLDAIDMHASISAVAMMVRAQGGGLEHLNVLPAIRGSLAQSALSLSPPQLVDSDVTSPEVPAPSTPPLPFAVEDMGVSVAKTRKPSVKPLKVEDASVFLTMLLRGLDVFPRILTPEQRQEWLDFTDVQMILHGFRAFLLSLLGEREQALKHATSCLLAAPTSIGRGPACPMSIIAALEVIGKGNPELYGNGAYALARLSRVFPAIREVSRVVPGLEDYVNQLAPAVQEFAEQLVYTTSVTTTTTVQDTITPSQECPQAIASPTTTCSSSLLSVPFGMAVSASENETAVPMVLDALAT